MSNEKIVLDRLAMQTVGNLPAGTDKVEYGSIVTIAAIISIMVSLFKLWKLCNADARTCKLNCKAPTEREMKILKRAVRRELGYINYWRFGNQTVEALLKTGRDTDLATFQLLLDRA